MCPVTAGGVRLLPMGAFEGLDLARYPKLRREDVRALWVSDFYDVPLSGALVFEGKLRWFQLAQETETSHRYVVIELSDEEIADEERWQALFVEHVGDHWVYRDDGERGTVKPSGDHSKFYEPFARRAPRDFSKHRILGWYET